VPLQMGDIAPSLVLSLAASYVAIIVTEFFGWRFSRGTLHKCLSSCDLPVLL